MEQASGVMVVYYHGESCYSPALECDLVKGRNELDTATAKKGLDLGLVTRDSNPPVTVDKKAKGQADKDKDKGVKDKAKSEGAEDKATGTAATPEATKDKDKEAATPGKDPKDKK